MTLIDGDRIITAQLYDDEYEEFTEKKMSIIDYINAYTDEGVTEADVIAQTRWIPVTERLPEDFGTYLITLENGDVCKCDFNPDFWDEDNNREGAFTYHHQCFDSETLGMIGEEEEVVDAIAWMPFEPYKAESDGRS